MLRDINQDLQIVNSEKINPRESTNEHAVAAQYVKDIKKLHRRTNARYEKLL